MLEIEFRTTRVAGGATNLSGTSREREGHIMKSQVLKLQSRQTSRIAEM